MDDSKVISLTKARVPDRVHTVDELCGVIRQMHAVETIVVLIQDHDGVWSMSLDGTTAERMNWILDRAKLLLHRELTPS
jgi:hypothetical protein